MIGDAGAYGGFGGGLAMGPTRTMAQGVYRIPAIGYDVAVAVTNTTPIGAFRGAGRPEAAAFLERIMDMAADELGIDPVEIRRRNFLQPDQFPYRTLTGPTYDIGDYDAALTEAVRVAGYDELRAEQAARRARGDTVELGIGVSTYVEITAGGQASEYGSVEVHDDGTATIKVGTSAHGQGHATSFAMIVSDRLGIPMERIRFVQSDTALVPRGGGTGGSRSLQIGGSAVLDAASGGARPGPQDGRRPARGQPRRHRRHRRRPARRGRRARPRRCRWAELAVAARRRGRTPPGASSTSPRTGPRSPSAPTSRWSRSTPRRDGCGRCATWRSTTAAASSTRSS